MATGVIWPTAGQGFAIDLLDLNTRSGVAATYYGTWGSGTTTPAIGDVGVQTENSEARTSIPAGSMSQPLVNQVQWTYVIVATSTHNVTETAVTTTSSGAGTCSAHIVHGTLSFESGDQTTYTVRLKLKDTTEA